MSDPCR